MRTYTRLVLGYSITAELSPAGEDWSVLVLGGCAPHVGSVSTARWEGGSVTVESLVGRGHKDHIVSERFALALAQQTGRTVAVTCGIHYDAPGKEGLAAVLSGTEELLRDLLRELE